MPLAPAPAHNFLLERLWREGEEEGEGEERKRKDGREREIKRRRN